MLKRLKQYLESEKKDKAIFDIIIYGSSAKGKSKPTDVDIVVIFESGTLRERLEKIQNIKKGMDDYGHKIDIKQMLLKGLFSVDVFSRAGIFLEGISIKTGGKFSERIGYKGFVLFLYDLSNLTHTEKIKFNYILSGRNTEGIIKRFNGERITKGAVKIPPEDSLSFEDILKANKVNYKKKNILEEV